jgi:hypothetical protein
LLSRTFVTLALCCGLIRTAAADGLISGKPIQHGIGIEVGVIANVGMSEYGDDHGDIAPNTQGIVIRDRNGMTSRMVIGTLIAVAGALAQSGPKSVESRSYVSGNYLITETTTTYYSEEEKAQMRENTSKAVSGLFAARFSDFELHLYSRDRFGRGDTSGYKVNFFVGDGDDKMGFETGFGFGAANSLVDDETHGMTNVKYKYLGMPFRVTRLIGPLRASLTYEWNWLKYGLKGSEERFVRPETNPMGDPTGRNVVTTGSHPWHVDVSTTILKRVAVSGGVTAQTLRPELGYYATAGFFF